MGDNLLLPEALSRAMMLYGKPQDEKDFQWAINKVDDEGKGLFDFQMFVDVMALFRTRILLYFCRVLKVKKNIDTLIRRRCSVT